MKIKFVQTGGFAGITKEAELDITTLPEEEAVLLRNAVEQSGFFDLQSKDSEPMPDMEQFYITVEIEGKSHIVRLTTLDIPVPLKPLVEDLKKHAKIKQF